MKRLLLHIILLITLPVLPAGAAETIVVGTVSDAESGQPVVNANVYYKGTHIGCATNEEGLFMVRTDLGKTQTLIVSALGYKTQRFKVEPGAYAGVEVELQAESTWIGEVFATPGANPALPLMERARAARNTNDISRYADRAYGIEENKHLYISDIRSNHLRRSLWKSLQKGMVQTEDSSLLLPLYVSRQVWALQGNTATPAGPAEERSAVMTTTDYSVLLDGIGHRLNFYDNTLCIFGHNFISPLATSGNNHYKYYLADSLQQESGKAYIVHFRSKNPYEPSFNGQLTLDSATCALQHIEARVPAEVSVNYLRSLQVEQTYSGMLPEEEQLSMVFDFAVKADTSHIFPTALLTRYSRLSASADGAYPAPERLPETVMLRDSLAAAAMDSIERHPIVRTAKLLAHIINTGNIPTGTCVDFGNVVELIGGSRQEGFHVGLPLTTNEKLWKNVELSGYVGYGFKDRAVKYRAQVKWRLSGERRHLVGAHVWDHYVQTDISTLDYRQRENDIFYGDQDFAHMVFGSIRYARQAADATARRREVNIWTENDWNDMLETQFALRIGRMSYGEPLAYESSSYRFKTLQAAFRIGWEERKVDLYMRRIRLHSRYPVVHLLVEGGSYRLDNMEQDDLYARVGILVQQTIQPGMLGRIDYSLQAGAVFGRVPYPLLEHFTGNQSYTYDPYRFTLMNTYQYAADRWLSAHVHWNLQGALFNRIPGIRYLRLRELLEVKAAWGWLGPSHADVTPLPYGMGAMRVPYVEAGIGIGNILRVADVYAVFRLTDLKNTDTPWWGIRARFSLGF